ncbi:MAG: hypothetical protein ACTSYM_06415 [Candidatus Baldrarchaeia archaeon]
MRILKYVLKNMFFRKIKIVLLTLVVCNSLFIALYTTQRLSNEMYGFVISRSPINDYVIDSMVDLQDITYLVKVSYLNVSDSILYKVDWNFKKFARSLLVEGRLPKAERELLVVWNRQNLSVGDEVLINGSAHRIVGILDSEKFPSILNLRNKCVLIKISRDVRNVSILIFGVFIFANITDLEIKIESLVGEDKIVTIYTPERIIVHLMVTSSIFVSVLVNIAVLFLSLIDVRKEVAIIFSIGWKYVDVLKRVYIEILMLFFGSYVAGVIVSYFVIYFIFKFYFFWIPTFQFVILLYLLIAALTFIFFKFLVLGKVKEVLLA